MKKTHLVGVIILSSASLTNLGQELCIALQKNDFSRACALLQDVTSYETRSRVRYCLYDIRKRMGTRQSIITALGGACLGASLAAGTVYVLGSKHNTTIESAQSTFHKASETLNSTIPQSEEAARKINETLHNSTRNSTFGEKFGTNSTRNTTIQGISPLTKGAITGAVIGVVGLTCVTTLGPACPLWPMLTMSGKNYIFFNLIPWGTKLVFSKALLGGVAGLGGGAVTVSHYLSDTLEESQDQEKQESYEQGYEEAKSKYEKAKETLKHVQGAVENFTQVACTMGVELMDTSGSIIPPSTWDYLSLIGATSLVCAAVPVVVPSIRRTYCRPDSMKSLDACLAYQDNEGETALTRAIKMKNRVEAVRMVSRLIHARPTIATAPNGKGETPVHVAASLGRTATVRKFVSSGVPIDTPNRAGDTPLIIGSRCGYFSFVRSLIFPPAGIAPADVNRKNSQGSTALTEAARRGDQDIVGYLLRANANVNDADHNGDTALHHVLQTQPPDIAPIVQMLCHHHATRDQRAQDLGQHVTNNGDIVRGLLG